VKAFVLCAIVLSLFCGCVYGPRDRVRMMKNKSEMDNGFFHIGMYQKAFLDHWGRPTKTFAIPSDEFSRFMRSPSKTYSPQNPVFQSKGRYVSLDVWAYENKNVVLVFYGNKLVGWKTGDEAAEIIHPTPK